MAIDKGNAFSLFDSASVAALGTGTGAWFNTLSNQGGTSYLRVTNGATGPNNRPGVIIEVADTIAGLNNREVFRTTASLSNDEVTDLTHHHALSDRFIRVIFDNGDGDQAITVEAHHHPVINVG